MRNPLRRTLLLLAGVALLGAACGDGGSPTEGVPGKDEARVGFALDVAGTSVSTIAVEVTAPDITSRLVFNIEAVNGVATGSITIPAGADRTITARAYDAKGILTHQGSKVVTVQGGTNTAITITLVPAAGEQPLTLNFGVLVVAVSRVTAPNPGAPAPEIGDTVRYQAAVRNADGSPVSGKVRWASANPAVATVDSMGLVTARRPGQVEIAATYQGAGGAATFTVRGDGTNGTVDQTAPRVTGITFSADSIDIAAGDTVLNITVSATDAGSGLWYLEVTLHSPNTSPTSFQVRWCRIGNGTTPSAPSNQVSWTCRIAFSPLSAAGTWTINNVQVNDRSGNYRLLNAEQLAESGFRTTLKVVNPNADTTAPTASSLSIAPDSINLTTATDTTVTITVSASDVGAGVEWVIVEFRTSFGYAPGCSANRYSLPPGTATNQVTWSCKLTFSRNSPTGTYTVDKISLRDRVGNERVMRAEQIAAAGLEKTFKLAK